MSRDSEKHAENGQLEAISKQEFDEKDVVDCLS